MRKIIVGIALISSTFFYWGCKEKSAQKTDTVQQQVDNRFVGTWVGKDYDTDVETVTEQIKHAGREVTQATTMVFDANGTFTEIVAKYTSTGKWSSKGDSLTVSYVVKAGPNDRKENHYKVVSVNDSLMQLNYSLGEYGTELYTYRKEK